MRRLMVLAFMAAAIVGAVGFRAGSASAQAALPTANAGGPYAGVAGLPITMSGALSSGMNLTFAWSFGDGTTGTGSVVNHAYSAANVYVVSLTVTDSFGQSATATTTASVGLTGGNGCVSTIAGVVCNGGFGFGGFGVGSGCVSTFAGIVCNGGVGFGGVGFGGVGIGSSCFSSASGLVCTGGLTGGCFNSGLGVVCTGGGFGVPAFCGTPGSVFNGVICTGTVVGTGVSPMFCTNPFFPAQQQVRCISFP